MNSVNNSKLRTQNSKLPGHSLLWTVPLGWQLTVLYTFLLAATLAIVGVVVYTTQSNFLVNDAAMRLQVEASHVIAPPDQNFPQNNSGPQSEHGDFQGELHPGDGKDGGVPTGPQNQHDFQGTILRNLRGPDVAVTLRDARGSVITSTQATTAGSQPAIDPVTPEQIAAVLSNDQPVHWVAAGSDGSRRVVVLMSIPGRAQGTPGASDNPQTLLLEQSESLAAADASLNQLGLFLLLGVLGGTLAGLVFGLALTRVVLRPLDRVVDTAEAISAGDLQRRLRLPPGSNEVARLGSAFDHMVGRLVATLEAQRRFVADASHELRTPLTSLKGLAEILMIGAHGNDRRVVEQSAGAINSELERLIRLVTDLLTLSRLDSAGGDEVPPARRSRMDVCATIESAASQMGPLAEARGITLTEKCSGPTWVFGDPSQVKQVLLNLLDNAVRHTSAGGEVRLEGSNDGAAARIEVSDTGSGIDPKELPHIFDRFYRGDTSRSRGTGNTGLGLAIARSIVEAHGGTIEAQSTPGAGTVFTVRLPLAPEHVASDGESTQSAARETVAS